MYANVRSVVDHRRDRRPWREGARPLPALLGGWLILVLIACTTGGAIAAVPGDEEVLEVLPQRLDGVEERWQPLRRAVADRPEDPAAAAALARAYFDYAQRESQPRYLGYARAVLAPWWALPQPPAEVLLLRAVLRQNAHEFDAALADLDALLRRQPRHAQAWLTRATIERVRGDYPAALRSCLALAALSDAFVAGNCLAPVLGLTGRAEQGLELLRRLERAAQVAEPALQQWRWTQMAELAEALDFPDEAERYYRRALAVGVRDPYLLRAAAEFLRAQRRPAEALALVEGETGDDALLLQTALAARDLGDRDRAAEASARLALRLHEASLRGSLLHRRVAARHALVFDADPARALRLARDNWQQQKDPIDALVLAEAARATGDAEALQSLRQWVDRQRWQAPRLRRLLALAEEN